MKDSELLELGRMHLEVDTPFVSAETLRDHLIELISWCAIRGIALRRYLPFSANSCRSSLCREFATSWIWCCYNSPQSVPTGRMLLGPYGLVTIFVLSYMENGHPYESRVTIAYFFTSHDHIHQVQVLWGTLPLPLVFRCVWSIR